jgi:hypothetical protein
LIADDLSGPNGLDVPPNELTGKMPLMMVAPTCECEWIPLRIQAAL